MKRRRYLSVAAAGTVGAIAGWTADGDGSERDREPGTNASNSNEDETDVDGNEDGSDRGSELNDTDEVDLEPPAWPYVDDYIRAVLETVPHAGGERYTESNSKPTREHRRNDSTAPSFDEDERSDPIAVSLQTYVCNNRIFRLWNGTEHQQNAD